MLFYPKLSCIQETPNNHQVTRSPNLEWEKSEVRPSNGEMLSNSDFFSKEPAQTLARFSLNVLIAARNEHHSRSEKRVKLPCSG